MNTPIADKLTMEWDGYDPSIVIQLLRIISEWERIIRIYDSPLLIKQMEDIYEKSKR